MLCMMTLAVIVGEWVYAMHNLSVVIVWILTLWFSLSIGLYISAFLVTEIMAAELGYKNNDRDFALIAYSSVAVYIVITIVALFPFFKEFLVLALYSGYLFWQGIPQMIQEESKIQTKYRQLSAIIAIVSFALVLFFFYNMFKVMLL